MNQSEEIQDFKVSARITTSKNYEIEKAVEVNDGIHNKTIFIQQAIDFYLDHLAEKLNTEERQKIIIQYLSRVVDALGPNTKQLFWQELGLYGQP